MDSEKVALYFCPGCGAVRNQKTRRCISCGRVFHDEIDTTETVHALTHPQTIVRYRPRSKFSHFLDRLFTFRSVLMLVGVD